MGTLFRHSDRSEAEWRNLSFAIGHMLMGIVAERTRDPSTLLGMTVTGLGKVRFSC